MLFRWSRTSCGRNSSSSLKMCRRTTKSSTTTFGRNFATINIPASRLLQRLPIVTGWCLYACKWSFSSANNAVYYLFLVVSFNYRAMLCSMHSADYAVARCLSVRRCCVDTAEHILKLFQWPLSTRTKRNGNIPTGTPLTGSSNARVMKKSRFSTNVSL